MTRIPLFAEDPLFELMEAIREDGKPELQWAVYCGSDGGDILSAVWGVTDDVASMATVLRYAAPASDGELGERAMLTATVGSIQIDRGRYRYWITGLPKDSYVVVDFDGLWGMHTNEVREAAQWLREAVPKPPTLARLLETYGRTARNG